jgi:MOSC domain-containing protein YiiM
MQITIAGVYAGTVQAMPEDGRPTAIFKTPVQGPVRVMRDGLEGDQQADRRVHGGPDKAVHHFPAENYGRLAARFPALAVHFVPGRIGENVSTEGCDEGSVCIGDVYALGSARVQLCQPRSPCWKIDARFGAEGITRYVAEQGIAGWYYRVLAEGTVQCGDRFELIDRPAAALTLARFWSIVHAHRPPADDLLQVIRAPGLAGGWRSKLEQRLEWLRGNAPAE